jgi:hypothetical protein
MLQKSNIRRPEKRYKEKEFIDDLINNSRKLSLQLLLIRKSLFC